MAKINTYQQDEELKVKLNKSHLQKAATYILPYRKEFILTIFVVLLATICSTAGPYIIKQAIDVMIPQKSISGLVLLGVIYLVTVIISGFAMYFRMKYMNYVGQSIIFDIRRDLFAHLQKLPFTYYDERPHGKIMVRVVNYVNSISDMFSNGIINAIMDVFSIIVVLGFMLMTSVKFTIILLCSIPLLTLIIFSLRKVHRKAWQAYSDKNSNLNAYLHESINGIRVTQAFAREKKNARIFTRISGDTFRHFMKGKAIEFLIWPTTMLISDFTICTVYFLGVAAIFRGEITVGVVIAIIAYIGRFWGPINNMSSLYNSVMTNAAYLDRIFETMNEEITIEDAPDAYELPKGKGTVEFVHVSFSYEEGRPVLQDISFRIEPGQSVALVGHTGAGKTTIVNLLSRYYDLQEGQICIDGHDTRSVTIKSLRSRIGYMLQDSFIFSGSILENIRYGKIEATDEEVICAAKAACAHDFIMEQKDGYHTCVSERGATLSAGQRQLISLSRAMLKNPDILVLDEATSAIDTETEARLMEGIANILKDRTAFLIAHRLSTIKNADRIMVIGEKSILEDGTHEELMALRGEYYHFYVTQNQE